MNFALAALHRLHPAFCYMAGTALLVLTAVLMQVHVREITAVREISVPIVSELPNKERLLASLQEQVELAELHSAVRSDSPRENMRVYSLPEGTDLGRLMAVFDVARDVYARSGFLAEMSDIIIGDVQDEGGGLRSQSAKVELALHEDAMKSLLLLIRLSGVMTVGDALSEQEKAIIVQAVETENPAGIVALEQFLSTGLPDYSENPKLFEDQLLRSFATSSFLNTFRNVVQGSLLREAQMLFAGDFGKVLLQYKLWPMQMMTVETIALQPGNAPKWHKLGLTFKVYSTGE